MFLLRNCTKCHSIYVPLWRELHNPVCYESPLLLYAGFFGGISTHAFSREHLQASSGTCEEAQAANCVVNS